MPMTFDTYSNCSFGCLYCFSQFQRALGKAKEAYLSKSVRAVDVEKIKRMFRDPDRYAGQFAPYIKQRRVMQWGGLSDEFDGYERKYGKTLELLRFFKEIDYPLCFSTKATWWTKDSRYMELVRGQRNWNFKFSIITLDEEKARQMERGVPTPLERLEAIERIAEADAGGATLRLRPFIIGISTPSYLDLIREAGTRGATALSTEFMCVELRSKVLRDNIQTADATVYAFAIRDHSMGYRFKLYDDRQFCNGHRTVTMGRPVGYLIDGQLSAEPNLRELIEARAQVGGNPLARIAGNEGDVDREIDALAQELDYAIEHDFQQPANFYGVGGMKIFRDLIWLMQGLMKEDHRFYKEHGFYDFPQKRRGRVAGMYLVGSMMQNKKLSKKLGANMTKGMLMPYQKVIDRVSKLKKSREGSDNHQTNKE